MNNLPQSSAERAMEGYAQRITARLNEATTQLDYHVVERLRAGRVQALAHRKKAMSAPKPVPVFTRLGSSLAWGGGSGGGAPGGRCPWAWCAPLQWCTPSLRCG